MSTTYAKSQSLAQKKDATTAASVLDSSSQSESLQRKANMANNAAQRAEAPRPNNTGMPDNLKSGIESLSGFSMDDVRVHYNSSKPATVQALAYTQGTDIHVAPGQEKHLPHEAWHVAQQMAGRVSPTTNINGMPVNDNAGLEHEADVMGEKAVQCKICECKNALSRQMQSSAVQRMAYSKEHADGTVSAETEQYEGNAELAELFGRHFGQERPEKVARKVDQYKKEMLTYIANFIEFDTKYNCGESTYGAHISVTITRGIWFVSVNSDTTNFETIEQLRTSAEHAKEHIKTYCEMLKTKIETDMEALATNPDKEKMNSFATNPDEESAKKQALYIAYRWAAKDTGIIVDQNKSEDDGSSVHGEMRTLDFLQNSIAGRMGVNLESLLAEVNSGLKNNGINIFLQITSGDARDARDAVIKQLENLKGECEAKSIKYKKDCLKWRRKYIAVGKMLLIVKNAFAYGEVNSRIIDEDLKKGEERDKINPKYKGKRVIRVGGTLTPCHDCAYEIGTHNKPNPDKKVAPVENPNPDKKVAPVENPDPDKKVAPVENPVPIDNPNSTVHDEGGAHLASVIGGRRAVTMTLNSGAAFDHWKFKGKARSQTGGRSDYDSNMYHIAHDNEQTQNYNELCDSYNSMGLDCQMAVFDFLHSGLNKCLETKNALFAKVDAIMQVLKTKNPDETKKNCFKVKNLIVEHLEQIYAGHLNNVKCESVVFFSELIEMINEMVDMINGSAEGEKKNNTFRNLVCIEQHIVHGLDAVICNCLPQISSNPLPRP